MKIPSAILFLVLGASAGAAPIGDLEAFIQSSVALQKVLTEKASQQNYRKALERYSSPAVPVSPSFEAALDQLRKLRASIKGVDARLVAPRKPLAFKYGDAAKASFRFQRIAHPLHSIVLLENLRQAEPASCTARDTLLLDRWTPLLKDASLFTLERNGTFLGVTITLVPIEGPKAAYLLAVPSDPKGVMPPKLLATFLRDYQKREKSWLPLALLSPSDNKGGYQIHRIDAKGARAQALGPADGFRLVDPLARTIAAQVPTRCGTIIARNTPTPASSSATTREPASVAPTSAPTVVGGPSASASANTNITIANPNGSTTGPRTSPEVKQSQAGGSARTPQNIPGTTIVNNIQTPAAGPSSPKTVVGVMVAPNGQGGASPGTASISPKTASTSPAAAQNGSSGSAGFRPGSAGMQNLSPQDRKLAQAIENGNRALQSGKPISAETFREIARGMSNTENADLKREGARSQSSFFLRNPNGAESYEALRQIQKENPELAQSLVEKINSELCDECPGCEYCREVKARLRGSP